jgi:methylated-DNA-[protein]-cysteine S-methyltransferase
MTSVPKTLDDRFRQAAADAGLLDVSFDVTDTPIGPLLLAVTERGLCRISFDPEPERETESLARSFGVRVLRAPREVDEVRRELDEYFEGRRRDFDLPLDLRGREGFSRLILERLAQVPYGEVTTYKSLAVEAGNPRAARAVGTIMNRNPIPIVLPCHRVVGSNGSLVGYGGGLERKRLLLELESGRPSLDFGLS